MYLTIFFIVFTLLLLYYKISVKFRKNEIVSKGIPGPKLLPFIGNLFDLSSDPSGIFYRFPALIKKYGSVFRIWLGPTLHLVYLSKPEDIEVILSSSSYTHKAEMYENFKPWLGNGLLIANGSVWFKKRKLMTSAFHFSNLNNFIPVFNRNIEILLKNLDLKADGRSFNIYNPISSCTLDIIVESAMNTRIFAQSEVDNSFMDAMDKAELAILKRGFTPWLFFEFFFSLSSFGKMFYESVDIMHSLTDSIIKKRKAALAKDSSVLSETEDFLKDRYKKNFTFLDMLLQCNENGANFSDIDLRSDVMMFILAGHGTTSWCLSWALHLLAENPEVQDIMYQEVISILGTDQKEISINELTELKYTEMVIKETLRHYPSVPIYGRTVHENVQLPSGYVIPANSDIGILTYCLHMDPEIFENPEKFNPDNFLPEVCAKRNPYAYLPFSAGPRNCIGRRFGMLQLKSLLSSLVKRYKIFPAKDSPPVEPVTVLLFKSDTGVHVRLERR